MTFNLIHSRDGQNESPGQFSSVKSVAGSKLIQWVMSMSHFKIRWKRVVMTWH